MVTVRGSRGKASMLTFFLQYCTLYARNSKDFLANQRDIHVTSIWHKSYKIFRFLLWHFAKKWILLSGSLCPSAGANEKLDRIHFCSQLGHKTQTEKQSKRLYWNTKMYFAVHFIICHNVMQLWTKLCTKIAAKIGTVHWWTAFMGPFLTNIALNPILFTVGGCTNSSWQYKQKYCSVGLSATVAADFVFTLLLFLFVCLSQEADPTCESVETRTLVAHRSRLH